MWEYYARRNHKVRVIIYNEVKVISKLMWNSQSQAVIGLLCMTKKINHLIVIAILMTKKVFSKCHTFYNFYGKTWQVCHHFTASSCGSKHQIGQVTMNGKKKYMLYTVLLCPSSKGLYSLERTITIMYNIFPPQSCQNYRITLVPEHAPLAVVLVLPPWFITVVSYEWGVGQKWSWKTF